MGAEITSSKYHLDVQLSVNAGLKKLNWNFKVPLNSNEVLFNVSTLSFEVEQECLVTIAIVDRENDSFVKTKRQDNVKIPSKYNTWYMQLYRAVP